MALALLVFALCAQAPPGAQAGVREAAAHGSGTSAHGPPPPPPLPSVAGARVEVDGDVAPVDGDVDVVDDSFNGRGGAEDAHNSATADQNRSGSGSAAGGGADRIQGGRVGPSTVPAVVRFSPKALDFGEQQLCVAAVQSVAVEYPYDEESARENQAPVFEIYSVSVTDDQFHTPLFKPLSLQPGDSSSVQVIVLPRKVGEVAAALVLETSDGTISYGMSANGVENKFKLVPLLAQPIPVGMHYHPKISLYNPYKETLQVKEVFTTDSFLHLSLPNATDATASSLPQETTTEDSPTDPMVDAAGTIWRVPPQSASDIIQLSFQSHSPGKYHGYVHIKTTKGDSVVPVDISVLRGGLVPEPQSFDIAPVVLPAANTPQSNGLAHAEPVEKMRAAVASLTHTGAEAVRLRGIYSTIADERISVRGNVDTMLNPHERRDAAVALVFEPGARPAKVAEALPTRSGRSSTSRDEESDDDDLGETPVSVSGDDGSDSGALAGSDSSEALVEEISGDVVVRTDDRNPVFARLEIPFSATILHGSLAYTASDAVLVLAPGTVKRMPLRWTGLYAQQYWRVVQKRSMFPAAVSPVPLTSPSGSSLGLSCAAAIAASVDSESLVCRVGESCDEVALLASARTFRGHDIDSAQDSSDLSLEFSTGYRPVVGEREAAEAILASLNDLHESGFEQTRTVSGSFADRMVLEATGLTRKISVVNDLPVAATLKRAQLSDPRFVILDAPEAAVAAPGEAFPPIEIGVLALPALFGPSASQSGRNAHETYVAKVALATVGKLVERAVRDANYPDDADPDASEVILERVNNTLSQSVAEVFDMLPHVDAAVLGERDPLAPSATIWDEAGIFAEPALTRAVNMAVVSALSLASSDAGGIMFHASLLVSTNVSDFHVPIRASMGRLAGRPSEVVRPRHPDGAHDAIGADITEEVGRPVTASHNGDGPVPRQLHQPIADGPPVIIAASDEHTFEPMDFGTIAMGERRVCTVQLVNGNPYPLVLKSMSVHEELLQVMTVEVIAKPGTAVSDCSEFGGQCGGSTSVARGKDAFGSWDLSRDMARLAPGEQLLMKATIVAPEQEGQFLYRRGIVVQTQFEVSAMPVWFMLTGGTITVSPSPLVTYPAFPFSVSALEVSVEHDMSVVVPVNAVWTSSPVLTALGRHETVLPGTSTTVASVIVNSGTAAALDVASDGVAGIVSRNVDERVEAWRALGATRVEETGTPTATLTVATDVISETTVPIVSPVYRPSLVHFTARKLMPMKRKRKKSAKTKGKRKVHFTEWALRIVSDRQAWLEQARENHTSAAFVPMPSLASPVTSVGRGIASPVVVRVANPYDHPIAVKMGSPCRFTYQPTGELLGERVIGKDETDSSEAEILVNYAVRPEYSDVADILPLPAMDVEAETQMLLSAGELCCEPSLTPKINVARTSTTDANGEKFVSFEKGQDTLDFAAVTHSVAGYSCERRQLPETFGFAENATLQAIVPAGEFADLGPVMFLPSEAGVDSTIVWLKNNVTGLEPVQILGDAVEPQLSTLMQHSDGSFKEIDMVMFKPFGPQIGADSGKLGFLSDVSHTFDAILSVLVARSFDGSTIAGNPLSRVAATLLRWLAAGLDVPTDATSSPYIWPFTLRNVGKLPVEVTGMDINGAGCVGYGMALDNCGGESFTLTPHEQRRIAVYATLDCSSTILLRDIVIHTDSGKVLLPVQGNLDLDEVGRCTEAKASQPGVLERIMRAVTVAIGCATAALAAFWLAPYALSWMFYVSSITPPVRGAAASPASSPTTATASGVKVPAKADAAEAAGGSTVVLKPAPPSRTPRDQSSRMQNGVGNHIPVTPDSVGHAGGLEVTKPAGAELHAETGATGTASGEDADEVESTASAATTDEPIEPKAPSPDAGELSEPESFGAPAELATDVASVQSDQHPEASVSDQDSTNDAVDEQPVPRAGADAQGLESTLEVTAERLARASPDGSDGENEVASEDGRDGSRDHASDAGEDIGASLDASQSHSATNGGAVAEPSSQLADVDVSGHVGEPAQTLPTTEADADRGEAVAARSSPLSPDAVAPAVETQNDTEEAAGDPRAPAAFRAPQSSPEGGRPMGAAALGTPTAVAVESRPPDAASQWAAPIDADGGMGPGFPAPVGVIGRGGVGSGGFGYDSLMGAGAAPMPPFAHSRSAGDIDAPPAAGTSSLFSSPFSFAMGSGALGGDPILPAATATALRSPPGFSRSNTDTGVYNSVSAAPARGLPPPRSRPVGSHGSPGRGIAGAPGGMMAPVSGGWSAAPAASQAMGTVVSGPGGGMHHGGGFVGSSGLFDSSAPAPSQRSPVHPPPGMGVPPSPPRAGLPPPARTTAATAVSAPANSPTSGLFGDRSLNGNVYTDAHGSRGGQQSLGLPPPGLRSGTTDDAVFDGSAAFFESTVGGVLDEPLEPEGKESLDG